MPCSQSSQERKDAASDVAWATPGSPILFYIQTEKTPSSDSKAESAVHILNISTHGCDSLIHPLSRWEDTDW